MYCNLGSSCNLGGGGGGGARKNGRSSPFLLSVFLSPLTPSPVTAAPQGIKVYWSSFASLKLFLRESRAETSQRPSIFKSDALQQLAQFDDKYQQRDFNFRYRDILTRTVPAATLNVNNYFNYLSKRAETLGLFQKFNWKKF